MIGIISGSPLAALADLSIESREHIATPYGEHSARLARGRCSGVPVVLLARHGEKQEIAPHRVNYRANLWALHSLGVRRVIAVNTVGGIVRELGPGMLAIPGQIVDYTWGRAHTFYDTEPVEHREFTHPYTEGLRLELIAAAERAGVDVWPRGTYGATQGPRLETAAEIDRLERDGCDLVGMTGMPEAALACELELDYACIAVVVNRAAGRGSTAIAAQVQSYLAKALADVCLVLGAFLRAQHG
jgi:5'-methylthioadenosine phosphorylase/5'-methylthioinosine phosphorylase